MNKEKNFQFLSLRLKNYRQYGGDHIIDLRPKDEKLVNVIQGTNGSGKSNILNALNYCLYEDEPHLKKETQSMPMVNLSVLENTPVGDEIEIIIELIFGNDSKQYKVARKISFYKPELQHHIDEKGNKLVRLESKGSLGSFPIGSRPDKSSSFQYAKKAKDWESSSNVDAEIEKLLPRSLRAFYFIDGEFLESLASTFEGVGQSVEDISHITLVNHAIGNIKKVTRDFEKKTKGVNPETDELREKKDQHNRWLESFNMQGEKQYDRENPVEWAPEGEKTPWYHYKSGVTRRESKEKERIYLKKRISDIDNQITKGQSPELIKEWLADVKTLEKKLPKKYDDLDELKQKKYEYIVNEGPFIYLLDAINYTCNLIDNKRIQGKLPVKYNEMFFNDLMNAKECICGTDLSHGEARDRVVNWSKKEQLNEKLDACVEVGASFKTKLQNFDSEVTILDEIRRQINDLDHEIKELEDEKLAKEAKLGTVKAPEVEALTQERGAKQRIIEQIDDDLINLRIDIKDRQQKRNAFQTEFTKAVKQIEKLHEEGVKLDVCKNFLNYFRDVRTVIIEKFRNRVETKTKEFFFKLIWKEDTFTDITIDTNYHLKVIHKKGFDAVGNLAAGEKLVLALSFVAAIRTITGHKFPLVIDTPLGKLAGVQKTNVGKLLPDFLEDTQLTLLATNTEYQSPIKDEYSEELTGSVRELFKEKINVEYKIEYDEKEGTSSIGDLP